MTENAHSQAPDLQSILATLANFAAPTQQSHTNGSAAHHDQASVERSQPTPAATESRTRDPRLTPQSRSTASPQPMIDPATITTWQDGLRCVTKIAAQNASFADSIRKIMGNQRQNEMRWYAERQALKQSQASRERASAQASEILKGLGNGGDATSTNGNRSDEVDLDTELTTFDRKIYVAQLQMDAAITAELKGLGVPFFGTEQNVVVSDERDIKDLLQRSNGRPKHSPLVTERQLLELRRRMVEHLEALYRD